MPIKIQKDLPARIFLDGGGGRYEQAEAAGKTAVRVLAGRKSPILTKTKKGDRLLIVDSVDDWTRVRTADGFVGYLKTKDLTIDTMTEKTYEYYKKKLKKEEDEWNRH